VILHPRRQRGRCWSMLRAPSLESNFGRHAINFARVKTFARIGATTRLSTSIKIT
jgi:hypothetical protein